VAPTTTEDRARYITSQAAGFVYYVSLKGTTGSASLDPVAAGARLRWLRELTPLPVMCGFGIRDAASARAMAAHADGVVVGSALVATIAALGTQPENIPEALRSQVAAIRSGLDRAPEHS
jgi:tryptophan synthase alpha chain